MDAGKGNTNLALTDCDNFQENVSKDTFSQYLNLDALIKATKMAAETSSTTSVFIKHMDECLRILNGYYHNYDDNHFLIGLFHSEYFSNYLSRIIDHSVISEFTNRDYFSYDKSDFEDHSEILECVLVFFIKLLSGLREPSEGNGESEASSSFGHIISQKLINHLPHILLTVSGHANNPIWSSQECQRYSLQLIHIILQLFQCTTVANLLSTKLNPASVYPKIENSSFKHSDRSVLTYFLFYFEEPLSTDRWEKNPFLCESFSWLMKQLEPSQLGECINQVMAVSLNFLHNFDATTKLKGLQLLNHLIQTTSNEELRWCNRAEVIFEALKVHFYSKETKVLDDVIKCTFSVLKILEKNKIPGKRYHFVLSSLLSNAETENILALRRIYMSNLATFFLDCGILCIGHLSHILRVIENYLEVEDGMEETARLSALDAIHNVIISSWPRVTLHSQTIVRFLLKFVININSSSFSQMKVKGTNFKTKAEDKVIICLRLLSKLNANVQICLEAVEKSDHQGYLTDLLESWAVINSL